MLFLSVVVYLVAGVACALFPERIQFIFGASEKVPKSPIGRGLNAIFVLLILGILLQLLGFVGEFLTLPIKWLFFD